MGTVELVHVEAIHEALKNYPEVVEQAGIVPGSVSHKIREKGGIQLP